MSGKIFTRGEWKELQAFLGRTGLLDNHEAIGRMATHIETAGVFAHETITLDLSDTKPAGLSRRDEFALKALEIVAFQADLSQEGYMDDIPKDAARLADGLLAALDGDGEA